MVGGMKELHGMLSNLCYVKVGEQVTVKTVDNVLRTGNILKFEERVAIIGCGVHRYVVRKQELEKQGYVIPIYKRPRDFTIVN